MLTVTSESHNTDAWARGQTCLHLAYSWRIYACSIFFVGRITHVANRVHWKTQKWEAPFREEATTASGQYCAATHLCLAAAATAVARHTAAQRPAVLLLLLLSLWPVMQPRPDSLSEQQSNVAAASPCCELRASASRPCGPHVLAVHLFTHFLRRVVAAAGWWWWSDSVGGSLRYQEGVGGLERGCDTQSPWAGRGSGRPFGTYGSIVTRTRKVAPSRGRGSTGSPSRPAGRGSRWLRGWNDAEGPQKFRPGRRRGREHRFSARGHAAAPGYVYRPIIIRER